MLSDEGWNVAKDEQRKVCIEKTLLKGPNDMRHDACSLGEELLVVSSELGPPGVHKGSESEGYEVVYLVVEFGWTGRREEQRGQVGAGLKVREEETSREACRLLLLPHIVGDGRRC